MWRKITLSILAGPMRSVSLGAVSRNEFFVARSIVLTPDPKAAEGADGVPAIAGDQEGEDEDEAELAKETFVAVLYEHNPRSRQVHLWLLVTAVVTTCLVAVVLRVQASNLGLDLVTATRIGFVAVVTALVFLFGGLFRILSGRKRDNAPRPVVKQLDQAEMDRQLERRLYLVEMIVVWFMLVVGMLTVVIGALIVILANSRSDGLTVVFIGATAGALSLFFRVAVKPHHQILVARYPSANAQQKSRRRRSA